LYLKHLLSAVDNHTVSALTAPCCTVTQLPGTSAQTSMSKALVGEPVALTVYTPFSAGAV
jgi:hypothetical protein